MKLEDTIFTNKEDLVRTSIERMHIQGIRFPFVKRCRYPQLLFYLRIAECSVTYYYNENCMLLY